MIVSKHTKEELFNLNKYLRLSIPVVPIEFQLMYLYTLLTVVYYTSKQSDYYCSFDNVVSRLPAAYKVVITTLRNYRNGTAHEGIAYTADYYRVLSSQFRDELEDIAKLIGVELNWDNTLNINI